MRLKDAVASLQQEHPEDTLIPLYTPWGEQIMNHPEDAENIWQEYPRPALRRTIIICSTAAGNIRLFPWTLPCFPELPFRQKETFWCPFPRKAFYPG